MLVELAAMRNSMKMSALALALVLLPACNQPAPTNSSATPPAATATASPDESASSASASPEASASATPEAAAFEKTVELQGHTFQVVASATQVTITPSGLEVSNEPQVVEIAGSVSDAEAGDIDADGFPEIYVYVKPTEENGPGSLVAFASNKGKSITPISVPSLESVEGAGEGYRGGDEFRLVENRIVQRFPIYAEGDAEGSPSGTRQVQWRLEPGEATWQLVSDKVVAY